MVYTTPFPTRNPSPMPPSTPIYLTLPETLELFTALRHHNLTHLPIPIQALSSTTFTTTLDEPTARALQRRLGTRALPALRVITAAFGEPPLPPAVAYGYHPGCEGIACKSYPQTTY